MTTGLTMPDFAVRDVVEASLDAMVADPRALDQMLAARSVAERDSIRTALENRTGKVRLGWPLEVPEDWLVTVLLASTSATHTLAEQVSDEVDDPIDVRTLTDAIGAEPDTALPLASVPIDIDPRGIARIEGEHATYRIDTGVVVLEDRGIRGTTPSAHAGGAVVTFLDLAQFVGWTEIVDLRLDIMAGNATFVTALAHMLRPYLLLQRARFDAEGITLMDISESDLQPRLAMIPAHMMSRTLLVRARVMMALPEFLPVLTKTTVALNPEGIGVDYGPQAGLTD